MRVKFVLLGMVLVFYFFAGKECFWEAMKAVWLVFEVESGVEIVTVTGFGLGFLSIVLFSFSFKWGPFLLSLLLFKFVEVSISSSCCSGRWCFFPSFFFLFLSGGGVVCLFSVVVSHVVVGLSVVSVLVASVGIFFGGDWGFFPFSDYLGPPLFFVWVVPMFCIFFFTRVWCYCCCSCYCCCCVWRCSWHFGCLRAGSGQVPQLLAWPAEGPPAVDYHHHISFLIFYDMRYGLEPLPVEAHIDDVVTVCCPGERPRKCDLVHFTVLVKVCGKDVPI